MKKILRKILNNLPTYPHYKMNIFSGTNTFSEVIIVLKNLIFKRDNITEGDELNEYHDLLESKFNTNVYTFASGRMGFYAILKSINIKEYDEIIIPSFTCVVVVNAILYCKAKPIYCDIKKDDFNIDVSLIENLITKNTKVIYAQHTFGQMCNIESILGIAKKYNLVVVEDCALSIGAERYGKMAGTIGDFGYFSTDRSKIFNTGLGGVVLVNNEFVLKKFDKYYASVPHLSKKNSTRIALTFIINFLTLNPKIYWIGKTINALLFKMKILMYFLDEGFTDKSQIKHYEYPSKFSNILASTGISQLKMLSDNIENRRSIARYYNGILKIYSDSYISLSDNVFLRYSFLIKNRDMWEARFSSLIDLSIWFKDVANGMKDHYSIQYKNNNKVSEYVCEHIFNLPTHNNINCYKLEKLLYALKESGDIIEYNKL